ncbi:hypothetical protein ACJMK2_041939 [Sinanodonta woodiana]|uniref:Sulfhydryl light chain n=1 Tax=Sinanodonta woodiana TaxID=1069815 RepID=A0ABD3W757_SINWO
MGSCSSGIKRLKPKTILELSHQIGDIKVTDSEIQEWYESFRSYLAPGRSVLTVDDFHRVFSQIFRGDTRTYSQHVFRSFDVNRDGRVDFKEFLIGLYVSGCNDIRKKLSWAFRVYDVDGNGKISREEMTCVISAILRLFSQRYTQVIPALLVDNFFETADTNQDGFLDLEEFIEACQKTSVLADILQCDASASKIITTFSSEPDFVKCF